MPEIDLLRAVFGSTIMPDGSERIGMSPSDFPEGLPPSSDTQPGRPAGDAVRAAAQSLADGLDYDLQAEYRKALSDLDAGIIDRDEMLAVSKRWFDHLDAYRRARRLRRPCKPRHLRPCPFCNFPPARCEC